MEFDRPIYEELGAALGRVDDKNSVRDDGTPELHPEQQIRDEEEMRTPPRRQPRGVGSQQPRGPHVGVDESTSGPGYMAVPPAKTLGRNRLYSEWSPVEKLEGTVSRMQRDLDNLQTENRFLRTRRATGPVPLVQQAALTTTKVPWFSLPQVGSNINKYLMQLCCRMDGTMRPRRYSCYHTYREMP